jgi:putative PEP-CTERM system histidine kinase
VTDERDLCAVSAKLIAELFDVLSVTIWLLDDETERLIVGASTAPQVAEVTATRPRDVSSIAVSVGLRTKSSPFDLEHVSDSWAKELRRLNPPAFSNGGNRLCVRLGAGEQVHGVLVLADRVNGAIYSVEELDLLKCIGDHMTSVLMNLRLANDVAQAKELDAFRTMSAFFVHDLKNAAASLNLMLKNLTVHFDDPGFRQDALRTVRNAARRIDEIIERLSTLRQDAGGVHVAADLNQIVSEALDKVNGTPSIEVTKELRPLPAILADRDQIHSVVTNLVLNAREAVSAGGRVFVRTEHQGRRVVLSVVDNGCGMTQAFLTDRLFRPFQSTKKKGLGIGLFQSRAIVQAHGGGIHVESAPGQGTTFFVSFPVNEK